MYSCILNDIRTRRPSYVKKTSFFIAFISGKAVAVVVGYYLTSRTIVLFYLPYSSLVLVRS